MPVAIILASCDQKYVRIGSFINKRKMKNDINVRYTNITTSSLTSVKNY